MDWLADTLGGKTARSELLAGVPMPHRTLRAARSEVSRLRVPSRPGL